MNAALLSSQDMTWQTPPEVLDVVRKIDAIALDPATTPGNPVGALHFYTPEDDGLALPWACSYGLTFVNPPYGRELSRWIEKMQTEARAGAEIVALIPARPDTKAWQDIVRRAQRVCFWRGRIKFKGAPGPAPFPSAFVYWGLRPALFDEAFASRGWVVKP